MKRSYKRRIRRSGPLVSRGFMNYVAPRILAPYGLALERRRRRSSVFGIIGALVLGRVGLMLVSRARRASEQKNRFGHEGMGSVEEPVTSGLS